MLFKWRHTKSFLQISTVSNIGLIYAGAFLFLMQMHGYSHTIAPDEFGFPEDSHSHAHEKMESLAPLPGSEYRSLAENSLSKITDP